MKSPFSGWDDKAPKSRQWPAHRKSGCDDKTVDLRLKMGHHGGMTTLIARKLLRAVMVLCLAVALVATGFGHRIPSSDDTAMAVFVATGGSVADLCADADGKGSMDHRDCPACTITAAADLPPATPAVSDAALVLIAKVDAPQADPVVRPVLDPARGLRAPPLA